jgi:hypothetical protein
MLDVRASLEDNSMFHIPCERRHSAQKQQNVIVAKGELLFKTRHVYISCVFVREGTVYSY